MAVVCIIHNTHIFPLLLNENTRRTGFQNYSGTKLYTFLVVPLPIISSWLL